MGRRFLHGYWICYRASPVSSMVNNGVNVQPSAAAMNLVAVIAIVKYWKSKDKEDDGEGGTQE